MSKKRSTKRNIIEWLIILGVIAILYFTGLYTVVIGKMQQTVLLTGLFRPEINIPINEQQTANYNFSLSNFNNELLNFEELKGKTIFLNFWASWCPPCRAEMPTIENLYEKTKNNKGLVFVLVSLDSDTAKARNFIKDEKFTFPVYFLNGYLPSMYNTGTIPSTFVISKEGKVVAKEVGMADYNTAKFIKFLIR